MESIKSFYDENKLEIYDFCNFITNDIFKKITFILITKTGFYAEPIGGLSHLLEHLILSENEDSQEFYNLLNQNNGYYNAMTDNNFTIFYFEVKPIVFIPILKNMLKMFTNPYFKTDRDICLNEIKVIDMEYYKDKSIYYLQLTSLFKNICVDEYLKTLNCGNKETLFYDKNIKNIQYDIEDIYNWLIDYYDYYYHNQNMKIFIAGDNDSLNDKLKSEIKSEIDQFYNKMNKKVIKPNERLEILDSIDKYKYSYNKIVPINNNIYSIKNHSNTIILFHVVPIDIETNFLTYYIMTFLNSKYKFSFEYTMKDKFDEQLSFNMQESSYFLNYKILLTIIDYHNDDINIYEILKYYNFCINSFILSNINKDHYIDYCSSLKYQFQHNDKGINVKRDDLIMIIMNKFLKHKDIQQKDIEELFNKEIFILNDDTYEDINTKYILVLKQLLVQNSIVLIPDVHKSSKEILKDKFYDKEYYNVKYKFILSKDINYDIYPIKYNKNNVVNKMKKQLSVHEENPNTLITYSKEDYYLQDENKFIIFKRNIIYDKSFILIKININNKTDNLSNYILFYNLIYYINKNLNELTALGLVYNITYINYEIVIKMDYFNDLIINTLDTILKMIFENPVKLTQLNLGKQLCLNTLYSLNGQFIYDKLPNYIESIILKDKDIYKKIIYSISSSTNVPTDTHFNKEDIINIKYVLITSNNNIYNWLDVLLSKYKNTINIQNTNLIKDIKYNALYDYSGIFVIPNILDRYRLILKNEFNNLFYCYNLYHIINEKDYNNIKLCHFIIHLKIKNDFFNKFRKEKEYAYKLRMKQNEFFVSSSVYFVITFYILFSKNTAENFYDIKKEIEDFLKEEKEIISNITIEEIKNLTESFIRQHIEIKGNNYDKLDKYYDCGFIKKCSKSYELFNPIYNDSDNIEYKQLDAQDINNQCQQIYDDIQNIYLNNYCNTDYINELIDYS